MKDQNDFRVAWSPSLLGDQAIERKNTNYFFYKQWENLIQKKGEAIEGKKKKEHSYT